MPMRYLIVLILLIQLPHTGWAQKNASRNTNSSTIISKQQAGQDNIIFTDSTYGYGVVIPKWWTIKETPSANLFGGTLPEIGNSQSALLIKSFEKDKFKTLNNFEKWVITGYRSGDTPKWSNDQKVLYKKNLTEFANIGKAYKVQLKTEDSFYNCCYIIVETSKAFLWIDLTATRDNYDANFEKLETIMLGFKIL